MQGEPAHVAIDVTAVERIAALGWRGLEEAHLGAWLLRAADGFTGRSNSAVLLGAPPQTVADWLPDLVRWYSQRGLPPMVQVPLPGGEAIDASLAAAGWRTHDLVRFLTGDITTYGTRPHDPWPGRVKGTLYRTYWQKVPFTRMGLHWWSSWTTSRTTLGWRPTTTAALPCQPTPGRFSYAPGRTPS